MKRKIFVNFSIQLSGTKCIEQETLEIEINHGTEKLDTI